MHPATAELAVDEPTVLRHANAGRRCPNPVLTNGTEGGGRQRRVIESRPVEIAFDAIQEISGLKIVSSLNAANELSEAAVEIVSWDVQVPARPRPAEIAADIKS